MIRSTRLLPAALAATLCLPLAQAAAQTVTFTSLPQGTLINFQVTVLSKMLLAQTDLKIRVAPMRGTPAQVAAIERGRAEFMLIDVTQAAAAIEGAESWNGRTIKRLRAVARMMSFPVGLMVKKAAPYRTVASLKGLRFPGGFKAFPQGEVLIRAMLATGGLNLKDVKEVPVPELIRSWNDFKAGKTDVTSIVPTAPKAKELEAALGGVRFIGIPNTPASIAAIKSVRKDFYLRHVKPAPFNTGVTEPIHMLAFDLAIATGTHVPDDVVAKVADAVRKNKAALAKAHATFRGFFPARMGKQFSVLKYHRAAEKYLRENKLWPKS